MYKKTAFALAAVIAMAIPNSAAAQLGLGVRVGTLGLGGEVSIGLGARLAVRGGIGSTSYSTDRDLADKEYTVDFPPSIWNVGFDFYPGGGMLRISAGVLSRKQFDLKGTYTGGTTVGNTPYSGTVNLTGNIKNDKKTAPYAAIGFGRTAKSGVGLFLDLGAAMLGDGVVSLTGTCTPACPASFNSDLQVEADRVKDDMGAVLKIHPILQVGLKIGFGG